MAHESFLASYKLGNTSNIVVAPCGSGKTGTLTVCFMEVCNVLVPKVLILTTNDSACEAFKANLLENTNIPPQDICIYTSVHKEDFNLFKPTVLITTYTMFTNKNASTETLSKKDEIHNCNWDFIGLDECHCTPAETYKPFVEKTICNFRCRLSVTATLVREDGAVSDKWTFEEEAQKFNFLGKVLVNESWKELERRGEIAKLNLAVVKCGMSDVWRKFHQDATDQVKKYISMITPQKLQAAVSIVKLHRLYGHVSIVYSDRLFAGFYLSELLGCPFLNGDTDDFERAQVLRKLNEGLVSCIVATRVMDMAFDILNPNFCCVICFDSLGGSRSQFGQRAGRGARTLDGHPQKSAYVYDIVTEQTKEEREGKARRSILENQGYETKELTGQQIVNLATGMGLSVPVTTTNEKRFLLQSCCHYQHEANGVVAVRKAEAAKRAEQQFEHKRRAAQLAKHAHPFMRKRRMEQEQKMKEPRKKKEKEELKRAGEAARALHPAPSVYDRITSGNPDLLRLVDTSVGWQESPAASGSNECEAERNSVSTIEFEVDDESKEDDLPSDAEPVTL